jgi:hypothetical protein
MLTLPGYFRLTKLWDLLVIYKGELIAAIELKSQVGPRSVTTLTIEQRNLSGRPMIFGRLVKRRSASSHALSSAG